LIAGLFYYAQQQDQASAGRRIHHYASDIDIVVVGGLKTLDPDLPIREPDIDPDYLANKPVSIGFGSPGWHGP